MKFLNILEEQSVTDEPINEDSVTPADEEDGISFSMLNHFCR